MTPPEPRKNRQSAYLARRRAALLRSAQQVLATEGPHAKIEEFAAVAEVSIATLYKHFGSKDGLIAAAQLDAQASWEAWMNETVSAVDDELEQLVLSFRLLLRIGLTHPQSAQIMARALAAGPVDLGLFNADVGRRVMGLVAAGTITVEQVKSATTIEELATDVREYLEAGELEGFVRTLRAPTDGVDRVPVFVFHPAGGSTVVYEPLIKRLPADNPVYGLERVEGSIEERAQQYVPKLLEIGGNGPFVLAGWSLGGALAYACAVGLDRAGADVRFVGLIDTVRAGEDVPQTKEEIRARWDRYALFAQRTFNVEIPAIPYEELENLDDDGQVRFVLDAVKASGVNIPGGVIEHQRTSYLDNRALDTAKIEPFDGHVTLYMADRYHDDAIMFEPRYGIRQPDGGWGQFASDLEVVPIGGEHIQAIDEPYIAKVGAHLSEAITRIQAQDKLDR